MCQFRKLEFEKNSVSLKNRWKYSRFIHPVENLMDKEFPFVESFFVRGISLIKVRLLEIQ